MIMRMKKSRIVLRILAFLGVVVCSFGFYFYGHNDDSLVITNYIFSTAKYTGTKEFRIVQLSDFHNHSLDYGDEDLLKKIKDLHPDVIVSTGDFIDDHTKDYSVLENMVASWKKEGIAFYYVDGNHERKAREEITNREHSIFDSWGKNLYQSRVDLGFGLILNGVRDPAARNVREWSPFQPYQGDIPSQLAVLDKNFDSSKYNIMLCHRPELFDDMVEKGYDLTLSGHTHGGQILVGHWPVAVYPWTEYVAGSYEKKKSQMIVNRGLGTSYNLPVRHNCNPEIVLITIKSGA
jgi:predicted MPP superfamily phosphohydrolase